MISIALALALAPAADPGITCEDEAAAATDWVSLVDAGRWEDSWAAAGGLFQSRMPQAHWAAAIQPVREPLGAVASRALASTTSSTTLPGAPDGQYQLVQFSTRFANKDDATETVVLACEPSGWKVNGYFIR